MYLLKFINLKNVLPVIKLNIYQNEVNIFFESSKIKEILTVLKYHFIYQFKILTCISGVDYPKNTHRFIVAYELLSLKYNSRLRVKILTNELQPIDSIQEVFSGAHWWECEIWDMFGVFFLSSKKENELVRLLTDYGFNGHPLRKDFPLSGFLEVKYNIIKNKVAYENLELAQEYRTFPFLSPWEEETK